MKEDKRIQAAANRLKMLAGVIETEGFHPGSHGLAALAESLGIIAQALERIGGQEPEKGAKT